MAVRTIIMLLSAVLFCAGTASAQGSGGKADNDSLVRLLSAYSAETIEKGTEIRKVIGPAVFLHNNTYLNCDTAFWYVDREYIDAIGRVSIVQDNTILTSDRMHYIIKRDLAQFRGDTVELKDKEGNLLRTTYLDYNTKDSVGVFRTGGAMRDKDGNVIESTSGDYDAKAKLFKFRGNVNMFTDSVFIKTNWLNYYSDMDKAEFGGIVYAWKDENMLTSREGWYDRPIDLFFFTKNVHLLTENQEGWCDSLYFNRLQSSGEMYGNVQITDEENSVSAVSGKLEFTNFPRTVTLTRQPAVIMEVEEEGRPDTLYFGADTLIYYSLRRCDVDSLTLVLAEKRKEYMAVDAISNLRAKNKKEEAERKAAEAAQQGGRGGNTRNTAGGGASRRGVMPPPPMYFADSTLAAPADSTLAAPADSTLAASADSTLAAPADSTLAASADSTLAAPADSTLAAPADSTVAVPPDTTTVTFLRALRNVRAYKSDLQAVCDSLEYTDLDSLVRMFIKPIIWNEIKNQFSSDSIYIMVAGNRLSKVSFQSNAFIHTQEDTVHYNQIKSLEMMAFFNDDYELYRFDALGGASAVFYLREEEEISLVNQIESKMLSASLVDGNVQRIHYYENPKNDIYPISQITIERQRLKGFSWQEERRPADRYAITDRQLRPCQRKSDEAVPQPEFRYTNEFFPGYIDGIRREIFVRDSLKQVAERQRKLMEQMRLDSLERARLDSLEAARLDSLAVADSLRHVADSLAAIPDSTELNEILIDSLVNSLDSIDVFEEKDEFADRVGEFTLQQRRDILQQLQEDFDRTKADLKAKGLDKARRRELRMEKRELRRQMKILRRAIRRE